MSLHPSLHTHILLDASRARRRDSSGLSSLSLLSNLHKHSHFMSSLLAIPPSMPCLSSFASMSLRGGRDGDSNIQAKLAELFGVHHIKVYVVDDHVILTG